MTDAHPYAFEVDQLNVNFSKHPVLWDVSLKVPFGNLVGIIGPNGAGKTTLIKTALDLVHHHSGTVLFHGVPLKDIRTRIAYVPQRSSVDWDFPITVRDLVVMGRYGKLKMFNRPRQADWAAADRYIDLVGLTPFAHRQISQLSGGQQQRAFLARALAQEAEVYFMDEPFAGVDIATEKVMMDVLKSLRDAGKTLFIVHHDLNTVENYFDWVILLNMRLIACGPTCDAFTPENLSLAYGKSYVLLDEALKLSKQQTSGL